MLKKENHNDGGGDGGGRGGGGGSGGGGGKRRGLKRGQATSKQRNGCGLMPTGVNSDPDSAEKEGAGIRPRRGDRPPQKRADGQRPLTARAVGRGTKEKQRRGSSSSPLGRRRVPRRENGEEGTAPAPARPLSDDEAVSKRNRTKRALLREAVSEILKGGGGRGAFSADGTRPSGPVLDGGRTEKSPGEDFVGARRGGSGTGAAAQPFSRTEWAYRLTVLKLTAQLKAARERLRGEKEASRLAGGRAEQVGWLVGCLFWWVGGLGRWVWFLGW